MGKPKLLLFFPFILLFWACKTDNKYNYAIKDFRKSLQPYLTNIVSKGIVMYDDRLRHMATDEELMQLSRSEHPVLRSSAFREILHRKSFNHFEILMNHLDDTALVETDGGEFGIWTRTVSDDILQEANWETNDEKNKTIEQVLTRHNYLRCAYIILEELEPQERYYPFVKDLATRPRQLSYNGYERRFSDIEYALYGLAKFKKQENIEIIKEQMMKNAWKLSYTSFRLMKEFPDTAYFAVLQMYHRRQFYEFSGNRPGGFTGFVADRAAPEDFIDALVVQQSDNSAKLLDSMLNRLKLLPCMPDKKNIIDNVIMAIWEHPCAAYARLRKKNKKRAGDLLKWQISIPMDSIYQFPGDTAKEIIRW